MENKFPVSKFIASLNIVAGWALIAVAFICILILFSPRNASDPQVIFITFLIRSVGLPVLITMLISGLAMVLFGEGVKVIIAIEKNTRSSAYALEQIVKRLPPASMPTVVSEAPAPRPEPPPAPARQEPRLA